MNIIEVIPGCVYRSSQPKGDAWWTSLRHIFGIRSILKLNTPEEGSDQGALDHEMTVLNYPLSPRSIVELFKRVDPYPAFAVMRDENNWPLLVHCTHGQDRTGLLCAMFRVAVCNWTVEDANKEMFQLGFHSELLALMWAWIRFCEQYESTTH